MPKKDIVVGIDIGSSNVRTVIAQIFSEEKKPRIIGVGVSESLGVRKGVIVNIEETAKAIIDSIEKAERLSGATVEKAVVSVGGNHISCQYSKGVVAVGRADGEVIQDDINRVIAASQAISIPPNKEIIHIVPKDYSLDDQKNIKDPLGMNGVRLEVDVMIIEASTPFMKNLGKCFAQAGVEPEYFVLSSLAASQATLSKRQKELGTVLVDIGGGTTSMAVFEEDELIHVAVIPVGAGHITNDIAIGLRTSIDVAEKVKLEFGSALPGEISKKEDINLAEIDPNEEGMVSRHHLAEIIEARMEEIFSLVNKELRSIGKDRLLPAGAVLAGGGAKIPGAVDLAKEILGLPSQTGFPSSMGGLVDKIDDPSFAVAAGLILWEMENAPGVSQEEGGSVFIPGAAAKAAGQTVSQVKKWFEKFLP